jgi:hypothetical protein
MKKHNTREWLAALGVALAVAAAQPANAQTVTPPPVPSTIVIEEGNEAFLVGHATGTQNYVCVPTPTIGKVDWNLFTPEATLFDDAGEQIITHFFSPNPDENGLLVRAAWQDSEDTSTVWARATGSSVDAAFVAPGAIPWLRLLVVGDEEGPTGGGNLTATTFIHRVNTVGGLAPSTGCSLPKDIGNKAFVPYQADYFFYRQSN